MGMLLHSQETTISTGEPQNSSFTSNQAKMETGPGRRLEKAKNKMEEKALGICTVSIVVESENL